MPLLASADWHYKQVDIAEMIRNMGDEFAIGRNGRRELVARCVRDRNRRAAFARNAV
jgi:hypothetical protein